MKRDIHFDFTGKTVIITGAARGIGRNMALQFAASGACVVAVDREADALFETTRKNPEKILAVQADIRKKKDVMKVIDQTLEQFGAPYICVNNAAVAPHNSLLEESESMWEKVYDVNCKGTFLMTQAAAKEMIKAKKGGRIINFSSAASMRGSSGSAAYASSRASVESFSRVAAIELAPFEILVNTVSPGLIDTQPKPLPQLMSEGLKKRIPTLPLARPGEPQEVTEVVMFLASEAASYITGSVIHVDGGSSIGSRADSTIIDDDPRYFWLKEKENTL